MMMSHSGQGDLRVSQAIILIFPPPLISTFRSEYVGAVVDWLLSDWYPVIKRENISVLPHPESPTKPTEKRLGCDVSQIKCLTSVFHNKRRRKFPSDGGQRGW